VTTTFDSTPSMSPHLLGFAVFDFDSISNEDEVAVDGTLHRVWAQSDSLSKARYTLDTSADILFTIEEYLGHKFELMKIDSIAVPGLTEAFYGWGFIAYPYVLILKVVVLLID